MGLHKGKNWPSRGNHQSIIKVHKKFILLSGRNGSNTEPTDVLSYAV